MNTPDFFKRSELTAALWAFRREFLIVGLFSLVANLLMLAPTIYMLQIFDRVLSSHSELTLLAVSLITLFLFGVMAFSEWTRSRVLVHAGVRFDQQLSTRVFNASFESYLSQSTASPSRACGTGSPPAPSVRRSGVRAAGRTGGRTCRPRRWTFSPPRAPASRRCPIG